jgi:outer membrane protein assembly factor BamB
MKRILGLFLVGCVCLSVALTRAQTTAPSGSRRAQPPRDGYVVPPGYDRNHIQVKFLDDLDIGLGSSSWPVGRSGNVLRSLEAQGLFHKIFAAGGVWSRLAGSDEATMDKVRARAQQNLGRHVADMNKYFVLRVPPGLSAEELVDAFQKLPEVEFASAMPLPVPPPTPSDFQPQQGYLNKPTDGIGASYTWPRPGGTGTNVTIVDLEYSWNLDHEDLPDGIEKWIPPGMVDGDPDPVNNPQHGTAVLGELASLDNGWGTTGIAHGATLKVAPTFLWTPPNLFPSLAFATQITHAIDLLDQGDVILIEAQIAGPKYHGNNGQVGLVPVEWDKPTYDAIVLAVGNGIHVVEAAGNGSQNLDDAVYSRQNNDHWPFLPENNSGAIMVGAGYAPGGNCSVTTSTTCVNNAGCPVGQVCVLNDRSRKTFSNYGSRLDLQGWGEKVVTTGWGGLYNSEGPNLWYEGNFSGTSSASPIVAGAVALYESVAEAETGEEVNPEDLRTRLKNTGSPQLPGTNSVCQRIGPRPNLRAALEVPASYEWSTFHNNNERFGEAASTFTPPLSLQWKATISSNSNNYGPVLSGGKLFTGTNDGKLRAFNAYTGGTPVGTPEWTRTLGVSGYGHAIPAVVGNVVYTTYLFPYPVVYALDASTGNTLWSVSSGVQPPPNPPDPVYFTLWQTTAVANGRIYVGTTDHRVAALNLNTPNQGSVIWVSQPYARVWAGAAVSGGMVVFGTDDSRVIALKESDGTFLWSRTLDDAAIMVPLIARGNVYVSSRSGITYAFKANSTGVTGDPVWQSENVGPIFYSTPAYDGSRLYYGAQNWGFIALDATTGATVWTQTGANPNQSSVAYANGVVYGTTINATLVALNASTGAIVNSQHFDPFSGGSSSPAVHNGWVWAEDHTGTVYAYRGTLIDADGDGETDGTDCGPWHSAINHSASESCDGVDNNCNGLVDDGLTGCTFCP